MKYLLARRIFDLHLHFKDKKWNMLEICNADSKAFLSIKYLGTISVLSPRCTANCQMRKALLGEDPLPLLGRLGPGNIDDDWLPDEIDMDLYDELEILRSRVHDPCADVVIFVDEPRSSLWVFPNRYAHAAQRNLASSTS
jgi:hypothetical protein